MRRAARLLERRWTLSILYASASGAQRFNEFLDAVGAIPPGTLATRLVELERDGVLERNVVDSRPPHVEYHLTDRGRQLRALTDVLRRWAGA